MYAIIQRGVFFVLLSKSLLKKKKKIQADGCVQSLLSSIFCIMA